jgi:hypothetical protein
MYISARGYYDDKQEIYDENIMTWIHYLAFQMTFTVVVDLPGELIVWD